MNDPREALFQALLQIPHGKVCGYGNLAAAIGLPGRARWVGRTLSELPTGSKLPWHRVTRANGDIAFPAGSMQFAEQRQRLLSEGVPISGGRVDKSAIWIPTL